MKRLLVVQVNVGVRIVVAGAMFVIVDVFASAVFMLMHVLMFVFVVVAVGVVVAVKFAVVFVFVIVNMLVIMSVKMFVLVVAFQWSHLPGEIVFNPNIIR